MSTNYGLQGRFAREKRRNRMETAGAVLMLAAVSLFIGYIFACAF